MTKHSIFLCGFITGSLRQKTFSQIITNLQIENLILDYNNNVIK
tara:strand:+ start:1110 stop:1241 length:132 start_codon:yes stop_codon:yes gene_type:complete